MIDHHARAERLRALIENASKFNEESLDEIDLDGEIPKVPHRFACMTYDGSSSWLETADTLRDMQNALVDAINGEVPWAPGEAVDLDTGDVYRSDVSVRLRPLPYFVRSAFTVDYSHGPHTYTNDARFATKTEARAYIKTIRETNEILETNL
jgi:hypothetical protein